ncbi:MAG: ABC transporter substrate-binding protein [Thermoanaerobaculia bacterium]
MKPARIEISAPYAISSLDPHEREWLDSFAIASHFYEGLVAIDREMAVRPGLALSWKNPDPLTWDFQLDPRARFHSGKPLRAEDVVFTIQRLQRDREKLEVSVYVQQIASVRALAPDRVEIRTSAPAGLLLNKLAWIAIVPKDAGDLRQHEDGTGPYRLARFLPGQSVEMVRNETYAGRRPALAQVAFRLGRDDDGALADFETGRCQLAFSNAPRAEEVVARAPGARFERRASLFVEMLGFDATRAESPFVSLRPNPFRNPSVREAVSLAIDRRALVASLTSRPEPAWQLVSPAVFGFDPSLVPEVPDLARARKLLEEAGYPRGFEVTLHTRTILGETAARVRDALARVGIRVTVEALDAPSYFALATGRRPTLFLTRGICATGDATELFEGAFHTPDPSRTLGSANDGGLSDPELDSRIERAGSLMSPAERIGTLRELMTRVTAARFLLPLVVDVDHYLLQKGFAWKPRADSCILAQEIGLE